VVNIITNEIKKKFMEYVKKKKKKEKKKETSYVLLIIQVKNNIETKI
jgi:hypothetical protein